MIKFFRHIRQKLLSENKFSKYLLYAIGEIILVVIGILIALQINEFNQKRLDKISETKLYSEVLTNLKTDSIAIKRIIGLHKEGIKNQEYFIRTSFSEVIKNNNKLTLQQMVLSTRNGVLSFFPQNGVYNAMVSNNDLSLINSKEIKSKLIGLYDYQYKRNENADIVMENFYQYEFSKFFSSKLKLIASYSNNSEIIKEMDVDLLEENYEEYRELLGYVHSHSIEVKKFLIGVQASIHELIAMLGKEVSSK